MMKKQLIIPLLLWTAALPVAAQKLIVEKQTVDVGRTGWQKPVTAVFELKVKGSKKVRIESVRPDCSCTVVDYPKGDQSDRFEIRMTYDARQLGRFDKQVAVKTNASSKPFYLCMRGQVLEHYIDLSAHYPVEMGDLRLDGNVLEFDNVSKGDQLEQTLKIYNNGTRDYRPNLMHLPSYLTATVTPALLKPSDEGVIAVRLNSSKLHDYGLTQTSLYLAGNPGDKVKQDHEVAVSAVLLPAFAQVPENPAHIELSTESVTVDFGGKAKRNEVITVGNTGRSVLTISSLQMFTGGMKVSLGKRQLAPGETTKLKITAYRDDLQKIRRLPRILMITNDPAKPKVTIAINVK